MISNQILQNTIDGVKGITKIDLSVVDADGNVLAETAVTAKITVRPLRYLQIRRQTVRRFWDTSFLRFMMRAS